jgi:lipoate synthase
MAIKSPHKLVKLYLSPEEYKKLNELAKEEGF